MDGRTGDTAVTLYAGSTPWDETEKIARPCGNGMRKDSVEPDGDGAAVRRGDPKGMLRANLKINGIPFVWQQKDKAADHPVCRMLLSALSCLSDGYRTQAGDQHGPERILHADRG